MKRTDAKLVILTGAGISAESGLDTFRAVDGLWENHRVEDVASPEGFARDPALVHRFYNARRAQFDAVEPNAAQAKAVAAKADTLRKLLVATKEGGAITGEERLREHMDQAYAAVTATEQRPTPYALAYIDALERELAEVEGQYAALAAGDVAKLSAALEAHGLEGIDLADYELDEDDARGGPVSALAAGLVGLHFTGKATDLMETGEKD